MRIPHSAVASAVLISLISSTAGAQTAAAPEGAPPAADPATTAAPETVELPDIIVQTAPAKRNVKKARLRNAGPVATSAEPSAAVSAPAAAETALPGIVVEGEKVARTLRDTTTSTGVVTGDQIRDEQIEDLQAALNTQANVIATKGSGGNSGFSIRGLNSEGLTQNQNPSAAPLISVVIDGATQNPEATRRGARGLWDVEQVEALRGPQSAVQSRNALAGSVFIKTKDPTYKLETIVEGTAGQQDLKSGGFVVNVPIAMNQAALRISGQAFERDHNISYGNPENNSLDNDDLSTIRGKLLLEPDSLPGLSALFTIARVNDTPAVLSVTPPFEDRFLASGVSIDFRSTQTTNYISDIGYTVTPGVTVRSITAYADTKTEIGSAASSPLQRDTVRDGGDFTQDLRLELENSGNGLSGVVGLFYGSFKFAADNFDLQDLAPPLGFFTVVQDLNSETKTESIAAYADLRYRFWDKFVAIGGGRILKDKVESSSEGVILPDFLGPLGAIQSSFSDEFTEFLPRAGLTYDLTSNQTVGVSYNKGYRNGFTELNLNLAAFSTVKPEYLDSYEVSYRSAWANNTFMLNANAFYYDYKDQQVAFEEPFLGTPYPASYILNADTSHAYGAEIEAKWRPISPLQLYASLGLMRSEFDSFNTPANGDFSGGEFPEAPAYTIAAGGQYNDPSGWFAGANLRYTDGYYSGGDLANTSLRFVDGYTLVDVRAGYKWDHYTLTVFAKNLFDEEYVTYKGLSANQASAGDEQLFGVTLRGEF